MTCHAYHDDICDMTRMSDIANLPQTHHLRMVVYHLLCDLQMFPTQHVILLANQSVIVTLCVSNGLNDVVNLSSLPYPQLLTFHIMMAVKLLSSTLTLTGPTVGTASLVVTTSESSPFWLLPLLLIETTYDMKG